MPNIDTASFYAPMNASISRARRLAEEKGMRDDTYTNQMRAGELADADQARQLRQRMFDEGGRQFDTKTNMFREMLARKMPDFFGAGSSPSMGGGYGQPDLIAYGGQQQSQDPGLDAATRNYLLRFLR